MDSATASAKDAFEKEYFNHPDYADYIVAIGISNMKLAWKGATLPEGENPEDEVISVMLKEALPSHLSLPEKYRGIRVVTEVTGAFFTQQQL